MNERLTERKFEEIFYTANIIKIYLLESEKGFS